jgi:hypothetical protein
MYYINVPDRIQVTNCPFDIASAFAEGYGGTSRTYSNLKDLKPADFCQKLTPEIHLGENSLIKPI